MNNRLNHAPCGFLSFNHEGTIVEVNQTFLQWLGYEQANVLNKHIETLLSIPNKLIFHSYFYPNINLHKHVEELFISLKHQDGRSIPCLMNAKLSIANGIEQIDCIFMQMKKRIDYEQELRLAKKQIETAYFEKEQALAKLEQLHIAIEQKQEELLQMNASLVELSMTDKLTGLKNRRFFQERLAEQFQLFNTHAQLFSLCILDIDYFKKVNDVFGHQIGDDVLVQLAQLLQQHVRLQDIPIRYGGEEFIVILPNTNIAEAKALAEHFRQAVEIAQWPTGQTLTISIGVATVMTTDDENTLLKNADDALYTSKEHGRNRVTHYQG
ncbi:sensor domain-containing diguanylate cyclase [Lysinibacillus piscis]|uniref:Diguanylate cyclase n=1 Tax=Lysinibacillus piscis TaxID=2518931 RepID=A0ABQ5NJ11_9BACI|nr:sensor domain-containing diguanylate cyclase [Lysinibacillus sp. KH24]GLC88348.1 hypothetical protein LYSBPC_14750 [Lysinibacillus sp. KH24]